jgi:dodecin
MSVLRFDGTPRHGIRFPAIGPWPGCAQSWRMPEIVRFLEVAMAQKVIDVVGISTESFANAARNAVEEAAKTIHGIKWARITEFEMALEGPKILEYRALAKIYFDLER